MSVGQSRKLSESDPGWERLASLGDKVDLDTLAEAARELVLVLRSHSEGDPTRLPSSLSPEQRVDLRQFVEETLADHVLPQSVAEIWGLLQPEDDRSRSGGFESQPQVLGRMNAPVWFETLHKPPVVEYAVCERLLFDLERSLAAVEFLDRLRG